MSSTLKTSTMTFTHSLGLVYTTMWIIPFSPCHPTQAMAVPIVSYARKPYLTFPGGVHDFHGHFYPVLGRPHEGFPDCGCLDPLITQAPHQCAEAQGGNIGLPTLGCSITGPSYFDRYRQYHCCILYQQTGWVSLPCPVAADSRSVSVATDSGHNSASQTHSVLPQYDSRPVILAEAAHHNRVESLPHIFFSLCLQFRVLGTGDRCPVTGLAGEVNVHVSPVSPAQQSYSEAQDHSDGRGVTHRWPLLANTTVVSTSTTSVCGRYFPYCQDLLSQQGYISSFKSYHQHT